MKKSKYLWLLFSLGLLILLIILPGSLTAQQEIPEITDVTIRNVSNTAASSVDPFLVTDRTGNVHLFWSEDVGGRAAIGGTTAGNTLMYSRWDGVSWTSPIDIMITPADDPSLTEEPKAWQPDAIVDDYGNIHLVWLGLHPEKLFYSTAPADAANTASAWSTPEVLDENLTGTIYSVDIDYESPNTLHLVYARVNWEEQYAKGEPRTLTYLKSTDGGATWSDPVDIAIAPDLERGFSNVRLLVVPEGKLYVSWTEWDQTGNGQIANVARSLDSGATWEKPVRLAERQGNEYERDWIKLASLGDDKLVATIEGGFRAYRQFLYSDDAGKTWEGPKDQFYWLIGENGFVEFARDGADNLHLFVAQRIREGTIGRDGGLGLWHSVWLGGDQWSDTELVGGLNQMVNPRVVIAGGDTIIAAWYDFQVGEILVLNATLDGVPKILPQPWLEQPETVSSSSTQPQETAPAEIGDSSSNAEALPAVPSLDSIPLQPTTRPAGPGLLITVGIISSAIFIFVVFLAMRLLKHRRHI